MAKSEPTISPDTTSGRIYSPQIDKTNPSNKVIPINELFKLPHSFPVIRYPMKAVIHITANTMEKRRSPRLSSMSGSIAKIMNER
jgi:hypothetical protein